MKKIFKYIIIFIITITIFNLLLFASSLFPSKWIEKNVRESADILQKEGNIYYFFKNNELISNDNYTDAIIINEAYSIDNKNPIYSYMSARKNYKEGITKNSNVDVTQELISLTNTKVYDPVDELQLFLDGKINTSITYARYWHGYLPIYRTLLIIFNISQIRIFLLIIFIILFSYFIYLVIKKIGILESIIFAFSLIAEGYFFVSYSLECAPVFLVMIISSIILLKNIEKIKNFNIFIFIIACITNFVDFLTVPLITLGIPLIIYILYKQKIEKISIKKILKSIIKASIIWAIGYALTWIFKWIIYDALYNEGLIKSAFNQVFYRMGRTNEYTTNTIEETLNLFIFNNLIYICISFNLFIFFMIINKRQKMKLLNFKEWINKSIPFITISIMPIIWYIALSNHTVLHYRFVYRHMLIFLIGILLCLKNIFIIIEKNNTKLE